MTKYYKSVDILRFLSLSELIPIIFNIELTYLASEASILYKFVHRKSLFKDSKFTIKMKKKDVVKEQ